MSKFELELIRYQKLADLGRELEGFVHNAASPLNIILGYVQMLRAKFPDEKGLSKIWESGLELDRMLKDLGSHIENSDRHIAGKLEVNRFILLQLELFRANNFFKHNVECVEEFCRDEILIEVVYSDFAAVMNVLLNNAISAVYGSDVKKIFITTSIKDDRTGKRLIIMIRDTGPGIDESQAADYFSEGFSGWTDVPGNPQGMGLAVAKYLCERLGARLELRNSDGIGAEAVLDLPLRDQDEI